MRRAYLMLIAALALGLAALSVPSVMAADDDREGPKVFDGDSVVYGRTYSEWSAAWEQWADSIPAASHPLMDNGDCSVGQSGPVWFLGGKFCALNNPNCSTIGVVRSCSVPAGKALYVAVMNAEDSVLEEQNPKKQIGELRTFLGSVMDGVRNLSFKLDGAAIPHLKERFRVQSPAFVFTIPDDNFFTAIGEGPFTGGAYFPGVDDGVYVMLSPLPAGPHVIHFHGFMPAFNFTLDITYNLTVTK
ncbi:MAG TPA: hypothetical protein VMT39_02320 [Candidatus Bathyarchaeia archaeon]|nr:hypothetical protein [Candidatus Bathyarchaeia archaeon]